MSKARRHESLIPLSREHHYALVLCLRINRGLPAHSNDVGWLQSKARQATRFFESDLTTHFKAEEEVLFPSMQAIPGAVTLITELLGEHRELEEVVEQLREGDSSAAFDSNRISAALKQLATLLEAHIRKEERLLFPMYEHEVSATVAARVESGISALIGTAAQPRHILNSSIPDPRE